MQVSAGGTHVHHHGILAGLGAGAAGVIAVLALVFAAWHTVSRTVGDAVTVIAWALVAVVLAAAASVIAFLFLKLRHHAAHPETLVRQSVRADVIPGQVLPADIPALPATAPAALPPGSQHSWRLPADPDAAIAIIRAITADREGRS